MDTLQQLPTHGDGLLDMRELARALLESMVNEAMDAQADMLCEDGANARNGYRERGLATPGYRQDSCALSGSLIGPPSGTAARRAASRPGSGGTPTRSPRRT